MSTLETNHDRDDRFANRCKCGEVVDASNGYWIKGKLTCVECCEELQRITDAAADRRLSA